jgi:hypothetical protein
MTGMDRCLNQWQIRSIQSAENVMAYNILCAVFYIYVISFQEVENKKFSSPGPFRQLSVYPRSVMLCIFKS